MKTVTRCWAAACSVGITLVGWGSGAAPALSQGLEGGWHIVRPGESLRSIAARYLGDEARWEELAALNEDIVDPDLIYPEQRVRVRFDRTYSPFTARIKAVSQNVEEQMSPIPWTKADLENLLNPRDGVRTYENSSAQLEFADTTVVLTEDSLVFLGSQGGLERVVEREEIEVVVGQADLQSVAAVDDTIEVIVGGARLVPQPAAGGESEARVRKADDGAAQVMVYEGEGEVAAGGKTQGLAEGMGTVAKPGEAPAEPERLLAPPVLAGPVDEEWNQNRGPFTWDGVPGAASYVLEVCEDPECNRLIVRTADVTDTEWTPTELPIQAIYWRSTAVASSGLDGYPSQTAAVQIVDATDTTPPTIHWSWSGPIAEPEERVAVGAGAQLLVEIDDAESGVEHVQYFLDGEAVGADVLQGPWLSGQRELRIVATDRVGHTAEETLRFVVDADPPVVQIGADGGPVFAQFSSTVGLLEPLVRRSRTSRSIPALQAGIDSESIQPLSEGAVETLGVRPEISVRTLEGSARIYVRPHGWKPLSPARGVWVRASDPSGEVSLRVSEVGDANTPANLRRLVVEASDTLGNRVQVEWPLWRGRGHRAP